MGHHVSKRKALTLILAAFVVSACGQQGHSSYWSIRESSSSSSPYSSSSSSSIVSSAKSSESHVFDTSSDPITAVVKYVKEYGKNTGGKYPYEYIWCEGWEKNGKLDNETECRILFEEGHYTDSDGKRKFVQPCLLFRNRKRANAAISGDTTAIELPHTLQLQLETANLKNVSKESIYGVFEYGRTTLSSTDRHVSLEVFNGSEPYSGQFYFLNNSHNTKNARVTFVRECVKLARHFMSETKRLFGVDIFTERNFYSDHNFGSSQSSYTKYLVSDYN